MKIYRQKLINPEEYFKVYKFSDKVVLFFDVLKN